MIRGRVERVAVLSIAVTFCAGGGCDDRHVEVRSYTVPKEKPPAVSSPIMPAPAQTASTGVMQWDLPDGWAQVANSNPMRFATLISGESETHVEIAITRLGGSAGGIAANINRWRGQVGLAPASENELPSMVEIVHARGAQGVMVDLIGPASEDAGQPTGMLAAIFPSSMHTWFIKTTGPRSAVEEHRAAFVELCESVRFDGAAPPQAAPAASTPALPTWGALPPDWRADGTPQTMSVASFTVTEGAQEATMTITPLGGTQDTLANVNRWRRQVGLDPLADLDEDPPAAFEVAGRPGELVDIVGTDRHTIVVISTRDSLNWFYKLSGPDPLVASQRPAFEAFIRTIRFDGKPDG